MAGQVPPSAYTRSLGIHPLLVDHPSLAFQLPQHALLHPPQVLVLVGTSYRPVGMGGMFRLGGVRLLCFTQPLVSRVDGFMSDQGDSPYEYRGSVRSTSLQAGLAAEPFGVRAGAALRGVLARGLEGAEQESWYSYTSAEASTGEDREHILEAVLGLGVGRRGAQLDAEVEIRWHNIDDSAAWGSYREHTSAPDESDTSLVFLHQAEKPTVSILLRGRLPAGRGAALTGVGQWGARRQQWTGYLFSMSPESYVDSTLQLGVYQDLWAVGGAVCAPAGVADSLIVSAIYQGYRTPSFAADQSYELRVTRGFHSVRTVSLVLSVEKRLRKQLRAQAGLGAVYRFDRVETTLLRPTSGVVADVARVESLTDRFSWGLTWAWRNVRLAGCLQTTLRLDAPLIALDVGLLL